jgi:hypothetical protein
VNLVPFAGIAFLWFIGVIRDRVGQREDRFFATVFLGSGLLFVAMLFVGTAVAGGLFAAASRPSGPPGADTLTLGRDVTAILVNIYSMRMAAVFTLTTVTIARRTQIVSRWLTVAGIAAALVLLVGVGISAWAELLFPAWILALSIDILTASRESPRAARERPPRADRPGPPSRSFAPRLGRTAELAVSGLLAHRRKPPTLQAGDAPSLLRFASDPGTCTPNSQL